MPPASTAITHDPSSQPSSLGTSIPAVNGYKLLSTSNSTLRPQARCLHTVVPLAARLLLFGGYLQGGAADPRVYICSNVEVEYAGHIVSELSRAACDYLKSGERLAACESELRKSRAQSEAYGSQVVQLSKQLDLLAEQRLSLEMDISRQETK